jgi:predicted Zn-dependent protease with MMP-like domain
MTPIGLRLQMSKRDFVGITDAQFDSLISKAMNELPQKYIKGLENVAIVMADEPTSEQLSKMKVNTNQLLLGLYEGIPLTSRGMGYSFVLPDKITLFKNSLLAMSSDENELFEHVKRTLWHEIAHYYGLGHDRIDKLQKG